MAGAGTKVGKLGVVGAGQMGSGIAQLAASMQLPVVMVDMDGAALAKGMERMVSSLARFVKKGTISQEEADATLSRVNTTTKLEDLSSVDFVVEAIKEDENVKKGLFQDLDRLMKPTAVLASNTSSISITRLAAVTKRPQQVIGMHFMNPPTLIKIVEIVRGIETSEETFNSTKALAERFGDIVVASKDFPGFIVNRILMPMINEAFYVLMEGVSSAEEIDTAMKYVDAGRLGRKSGRGVYSYEAQANL